MNSCEIASFVTATTCAIAKCVPREELPLIAAIFGELASTLTTIIVNEDLIHPKQTTGAMPSTGTTPGMNAPGDVIPEPIPPPTDDILTEPPFTP